MENAGIASPRNPKQLTRAILRSACGFVFPRNLRRAIAIALVMVSDRSGCLIRIMVRGLPAW